MSVAAIQQREFQQAELDILIQLVDRELRSLPIEIHHTRNNEFREELKRRLHLTEKLLERLRAM